MVSNANIIKKIYFPRLIIPVSSVLVALFDFAMTIPLLVALLIYYKICPSLVHIWMLPAGILLAIISTLGPGCLLAALNVKYRDFRYVTPFLLQFFMFVTPVIYPISVFHFTGAKYLLAINPMYSAVELFRSGFNGQMLELRLVAISVCAALFFFISGIYYFRKTEAYFADLA